MRFFEFIQVFCIAIPAFAAYVAFSWNGRVRPMNIPTEEIQLWTDELVSQHGKTAAEVAYWNEDRAWRYGDVFEQGKWRRIREELRKRSQAD